MGEIEADEALFAERKTQKGIVEQEWDEAQKEWVQLDTESLNAKNVVQNIDVKMGEVQEKVSSAKQALESFLKVATQFAQLKEPVEAEPEVSPIERPNAAEQL